MRGFLVPHTHWDREWYRTFQQFRFKLVKLVDQLLEIMERDPDFKFFTLDGQAVVVEDYLEIKPENRSRLVSLIQEGRILIGPWYVLPDEFLVSGESLIRNLARGIKTCRSFGGAMMVGYVPDQFGHIAQLPQILKGFGIKEGVMWRGVGSECQTNLFRWESPDGTRITGVYLADSYGNAANLPKDPAEFKARISDLVERQRQFLSNDAVLFMNGSDHLMPQPHLPALLNEMKGVLAADLEFSSIPGYIAALNDADINTPVFKGEFRSGERAPLLVSCASSRIRQKQRNHDVEILLEKYAEPLSVWAWLHGAAYPGGYLNKSWEMLLKNHPHDSICGCSHDQVHREIEIRFDFAEQIAAAVQDEGLGKLAAQVDSRWFDGKKGILVFNPHPHSLSAVVEVDLPDTEESPVAVVTENGDVMPLQIVSGGAKTYLSAAMSPLALNEMVASLQSRDFQGLFLNGFKFTAPLGGVVKADFLLGWEPVGELDINELKAYALELTRDNSIQQIQVTAKDGGLRGIFMARDLPGCGWDSYALISKAEVTTPELAASTTGLENSLYRVTINVDGTVDLFDKESGLLYQGLNRLVDGADCGDLYTFSSPQHDLLVSAPAENPGEEAEIEVLETGPVRASVRIEGEYLLPEALTGDRTGRLEKTVRCPYSVTLSLIANRPGLYIDTVFENNARDHRLRARFPAPIIVDKASADGHFAVTERPIQPPARDYSSWAEKPDGLAAHKNFISIDDGTHGLSVINRGLPEYEVLEAEGASEIAITLVRSVGWLSRGGLINRPVHAGPAVETPEGQCPGSHHFNYCVVPHRGSWQEARIKEFSSLFNAPPLGTAKAAQSGNLPARQAMLSISPQEIALSCIKQSEDGKDAIVRLFNCSPQAQGATVKPGFNYKEVAAVNFLEEKSGYMITIEDGTVSFKLNPYQIITLRFSM